VDNIHWLILALFLVGWFVNNILRGNEEERAANRNRRLQGGDRPMPGRTTRRTVSDIDRFLDEVNRRRRQAGERRPDPVKEKPSVGASGSASSTVARPRPQVRPPTVRPAPGQPSRPAIEPTIQRFPQTEPPAVVEVVEVAPAVPAFTSQGQATASAPLPLLSSVAAPPPSPAVTQLTPFLSSPENLKAAFMLREILDKPRCRRYGLQEIP
jgi:hypothetical protein